MSTQNLHLKPCCVHEAEGRGRFGFAAYQMSHQQKPIFWITLAGQGDGLLPSELPVGVFERLHFVETASEQDLLWATEEALRSAVLGLVVAQPDKPLSLTMGRRLQLAAEAGQTTGLILIREGQGSNAAETRWQCHSISGQADSTLHRWQLTKNKSGTCDSWIVNWDGKTSACHMVSKARE